MRVRMNASTVRSVPQDPPKKGEAWERRADESAVAYEAFVAYREMTPKRSYRRAAQKLRKSEATVNRWRQRHEWTARARAYDERIERAQAEDEIEARMRVNKRHIDEAVAVQSAGLKLMTPAIRKLDDLAKNETPLDEEKVSERLRAGAPMVLRGIEVERRCRGMDREGAAEGVLQPGQEDVELVAVRSVVKDGKRKVAER